MFLCHATTALNSNAQTNSTTLTYFDAVMVSTTTSTDASNVTTTGTGMSYRVLQYVLMIQRYL